MKIEKEDLIKLLNTAIDYGGDPGGPYFTDRSKVDLINQFTDLGYMIEFDKFGFVKDIKNREEEIKK